MGVGDGVAEALSRRRMCGLKREEGLDDFVGDGFVGSSSTPSPFFIFFFYLFYKRWFTVLMMMSCHDGFFFFSVLSTCLDPFDVSPCHCLVRDVLTLF